MKTITTSIKCSIVQKVTDLGFLDKSKDKLKKILDNDGSFLNPMGHLLRQYVKSCMRSQF